MPPSQPSHVVTHAPSTSQLHLPSLSTEVNTSDPKFREGALYGAGGVALLGAAAYGAYQLYRYYSVKMTSYKLSYFNGRALAETSRYLFALAGVEYEDFRYPPSTNGIQSPAFEAVKDSLPFGQLPILQVGGPNGTVLAQSKSIERYLATQFGLFGSEGSQRELMDSIGETIVDMKNAYFKARDVPEDKAKFFNNTLVTGLRYIERLASQYSTSSDHSTLIGGSIALPDLQLFHFLSIFDDQASVSRAVDNFPIIKATRAAVGNHPEIQKWIAIRPNTPW